MYENNIKKIKNNQEIRLQNNQEDLEKGLVKLVLTIIDLLRQILERQAKRKIEANQLSEGEIEHIGLAFSRIKKKLDEITEQFGIEKDQIESGLQNIISAEGLLPTQSNLVDLIDGIIEKNVVIAGNISISVAGIDLIILNLLASITTSNKNHQDK